MDKVLYYLRKISYIIFVLLLFCYKISDGTIQLNHILISFAIFAVIFIISVIYKFHIQGSGDEDYGLKYSYYSAVVNRDISYLNFWGDVSLWICLSYAINLILVASKTMPQNQIITFAVFLCTLIIFIITTILTAISFEVFLPHAGTGVYTLSRNMTQWLLLKLVSPIYNFKVALINREKILDKIVCFIIAVFVDFIYLAIIVGAM